MKRFLSLLLAELMLIGCVTAVAETTNYRELGFAIDFSAIQDKSANYPFLKNQGVASLDPFASSMYVLFTNMPRSVIETVESMEEGSEDAVAYNTLLDALTTSIGQIIVTDANSLDELISDESQKELLEQCEVIEFGTLGDYHYYLINFPLNELTEFYDEAEDTGDYEHSPQEMKAAMLADVELVRSELLKQLQNAEFFEPVDPLGDFIGQTVEFESVDLDGNVVKSSDLFKGNKITMVNIWGSWCINCTNEMGELAEIHKRLQGKGCGIVGVEYEPDLSDEVTETARKVLSDNGVTYPNVIRPEDNPVFAQVNGYPFSIFVDSEGKILANPIRGAAVADYEPTIDKLLAGEAVDPSPETGSTKNESNEYRVIVYDTEGNPVKGVIVQLCDESTCSFQKTKADGIATFQVEVPKVYDVHVAKVPGGYQSSDETYQTLDTFSDVNIFISKAE